MKISYCDDLIKLSDKINQINDQILTYVGHFYHHILLFNIISDLSLGTLEHPDSEAAPPGSKKSTFHITQQTQSIMDITKL